ncbi:hypothetical protein B0H10DRAFT_1947866 [Mycena sp. CBHHK59/15]|nr:hypothetical protein B0H10DRAFT_1947866 [Mycena sp. CBHHK59/15]
MSGSEFIAQPRSSQISEGAHREYIRMCQFTAFRDPVGRAGQAMFPPLAEVHRCRQTLPTSVTGSLSAVIAADSGPKCPTPRVIVISSGCFVWTSFPAESLTLNRLSNAEYPQSARESSGLAQGRHWFNNVLPIFSSSTTADEVASTFSGEIQGKNVLITGTSLNGIGFETACAIAKQANLVIITGYNLERYYISPARCQWYSDQSISRLKLSEDAIKKNVPSANIRKLTLDLSSLAAVREAAAEVNAYPEPLHVGYFIPPIDDFIEPLRRIIGESDGDGPHGPFLFTKLLAPKLLAAGTASYVPRVVFVSSVGHSFGTGVNFSTIGHPDPAKYDNLHAYFEAKSANVLTAIELSKRSKGRINAYSLHPGAIYTNIAQKEESLEGMKALGVLGRDGKRTLRSTSRQSHREPQPPSPRPLIPDSMTNRDVPLRFRRRDQGRRAAQLRSGKCEKLWAVTEEIIGEKFTF